MAHRIEIGLKKEMRDPLGDKTKRRIHEDLGLEVEAVKTVSVFTPDMKLSREELETVATRPFLGLKSEFLDDVVLGKQFSFLEAGQAQ